MTLLSSDLPPVTAPATIESVLTRTSALIRKASGERRPQLLASNVDVVFIVMGLDGDFNLARLKRFLELVQGSGARPIIVANKADLSKDQEEATKQIAEVAPGVPIHIISALEGVGLEQLELYFHPHQTIVPRRLLWRWQVNIDQPMARPHRASDPSRPGPMTIAAVIPQPIVNFSFEQKAAQLSIRLA